MAADPLAVRAYYGIMSANFAAKTNIMTLLINAYNALASAQQVPALAACEVLLYAKATNTVRVLIGDENLTTAIYAYEMAADSSRRYGPGRLSAVPLADMYAMAFDGATNVKLGIELIPT